MMATSVFTGLSIQCLMLSVQSGTKHCLLNTLHQGGHQHD